MAVLAALLCAGMEAAEPTAPVDVEGGMVVGTAERGIRTYLGIPYAAPPVAALRWMPPRPVVPWKDLRRATAYAPACVQGATWIPEPKDEDCLYLNVWAPATIDKPLPVMVWIHGGGFFGGSGQLSDRNGEVLVRNGVILVTINYRLGAFGFFSHPELAAESPHHASGNQGLLDQIAALKWVKRNIAAFGGDPDAVTVFGASAGAESISLLMVSPLAGGLFRRAIGESGVIDRLSARNTAERLGSRLAERLGTGHLADLRALPAKALVEQPWTPFPNLDGYVLPGDPAAIYAARKQNAVPLLLGWNAEEGRDLAPDILASEDYSLANYPSLLRRIVGEARLPDVLKAYPAATDAEARAAAFKFTGDYWGWMMWRWAVRQQVSGQPTYLYYFVHSPAEPKASCNYGCGAGHGAEIRYILGLEADGRDWTQYDLALAERMARYWTNFAKTGDPNGEAVPAWPLFDGSDAAVLRLGTEAEIATRGKLPDFKLFGP